MDVLEALEPFRSHFLYPRARMEVLQTKRAQGWKAAREHAQRIADAMTDEGLERLLK